MPMAPNQIDIVLNGMLRHLLGRKTEIPKFFIKKILIFFDSQSAVHKEFVPEGKAVNAEFYKGVMEPIQRVRPAAFCCRDFFLLHDNVPAHKAASVCQFLTPKNVATLYHPPYSPELSPPEHFLFPKFKMKVKGLHFVGSKKP